jgi:hypothetical protein
VCVSRSSSPATPAFISLHLSFIWRKKNFIFNYIFTQLIFNSITGNLEGKLSNPLDVNQFMSAFLLLGCGILLTIILLLAEHFYFRYCRKHLISKERDPCFTLISLVSSYAWFLYLKNLFPVYSRSSQWLQISALQLSNEARREVKRKNTNFYLNLSLSWIA